MPKYGLLMRSEKFWAASNTDLPDSSRTLDPILDLAAQLQDAPTLAVQPIIAKEKVMDVLRSILIEMCEDYLYSSLGGVDTSSSCTFPALEAQSTCRPR